jgi:hypothetical protein
MGGYIYRARGDIVFLELILLVTLGDLPSDCGEVGLASATVKMWRKANLGVSGRKFVGRQNLQAELHQ